MSEDPATDEPVPGLREEPERRGHEWWAVTARLLVALLVFGVAYVGTAWFFRDRPPAGLTVGGVDVGTLSRADAEAKVRREVDRLRSEPIRVEVAPEDGAPADELLVVPADAGLSVDVDATLADVVGFSLDPRVLWSHVAGTPRRLDLVPAVDQQALRAEIERLAEGYDQDPVEGDVTLGEEGVQVTQARDGRRLDVEATGQAVADAWLTQDAAEGVASAVAPELTPEEIETFTTEVLDVALGEPVRVVATRGTGEGKERATASLDRGDLAGVLDIERSADHTLSLRLDEEALLTRVRKDLGTLERGPRDATVRLDGSDVAVVPDRAGAALPEDPIVDGVEQALGAEGKKERTVSVALTTVEPEISTAVARGWSFSRMGSFESVFPGGEANASRTQNLSAGINHLHGDVIMPGEQFSLGAALSPLSAEGGYAEAPIIVDGRLVMGLGGGLSQVSTTVFNTAWFSGVQLDAHTPHSFYIPRYPAGREATLALPTIDNLWTNDTTTPIVIRTWISGTTIHMEFLGDRQYDVNTVEGPRLNLTEPQHIVDDSPECVPQQPSQGFDISVARELVAGGQVVKRDEFTTHYIPEDEVVCTHPDAGY